MKLALNSLEKKFNNQILFEDFSYTFKENGLYIILGDSGSGKSTLLNILSLIDDEYDGIYTIDGLPVNEMKKEQKEKIRLLNFGYVFQNFNLFENDTVINNIRQVFDGISETNKDTNEILINELLSKLEISELKDFYVKDLSGGEKQRVAIARAIITSPNVVFCDEPTGSLDSINTENIFKILKSISKDKAVICVTHDEENAYKFGDYILKIEDKMIKTEKIEAKSNYEGLNLAKINDKKPNGILKLKYVFKHIFNKLKRQKIRNLIRVSLLIISLTTSGISMSLSSGVHSSLMNSFSSIIDSKTLILNKKPCKNAILDYNSALEEDVDALSKVYSEDIDYYGCNYLVDFENSFPDDNDLYIENKGFLRKLSGFSIRMFNEFIYENSLYDLETYPNEIGKLRDDEIVLSLSYEQMKELCLQFQILRDFDTLGEYLKTNDVYLTLKLRNKNRQYVDEQIFRLKGVVFNNLNRIYHTNPLFNEIIFEQNMRMPVSYSVSKEEKYPWIMKKVYFVHTRRFQTEFLNKIFYDNNRTNYIFDSDNSTYSPLNCSYDSKVTNRLYVYDVIKDTIELEMIDHLKEVGFEFDGYYFSSQSGYYNNGTSLFSGFAKRIFFSLDLEKNENIIDAYSKVDEKDFDKINVPKGVVDGYALKANSSNLRLKVYKGESELKPNEIVISKGFKKLLNDEDLIGKEVYSTLLKSSNYYNGKVSNKFDTIRLTIKEVVDDNSVSIYQTPEFSISLFRDLFKLSSFNLVPTSIIFESKTPLNKEEIKKINSYFSNYELSNPLYEIENSINESTSFLKYLLMSFSIVSIISSMILLLIITMVSAIEQRKDVAIYKLLGFSNLEVFKLFLVDNSLISLVAFFGSSATLGIISFIGQKILKTMIGIDNLVIFSPLSILLNLVLIIILSVVASLGAYKEIKNIDIVKEVH